MRRAAIAHGRNGPVRARAGHVTHRSGRVRPESRSRLVGDVEARHAGALDRVAGRAQGELRACHAPASRRPARACGPCRSGRAPCRSRRRSSSARPSWRPGLCARAFPWVEGQLARLLGHRCAVFSPRGRVPRPAVYCARRAGGTRRAGWSIGRCELRRYRAPLLAEAHAVNQAVEAGLAAQRIEARVHAQEQRLAAPAAPPPARESASARSPSPIAANTLAASIEGPSALSSWTSRSAMARASSVRPARRRRARSPPMCEGVRRSLVSAAQLVEMRQRLGIASGAESSVRTSPKRAATDAGSVASTPRKTRSAWSFERA